MENEEGKVVDLYVPRKCSATGKLVGPRDYASIQIEIADVDENGKAMKSSTTFCISGRVRRFGESDACMNRLMKEKGILSFT